MNLTEEEMATLKATKSESDWNAACDAIKKSRGSQYPPDWWSVVMQSGLFAAIQSKWN